jgi:hypothetical protein
MTPVMTDQFEALLARGGLQEARPVVGIGRELSFVDGPARQLVVHFGAEEPVQYLRDVTDRILALESEWLLVARWGTVASLGLLPEETRAPRAICFESSEQADLSHFLCTRPMEFGCTSVDLYALSSSGNILVTWDHHTASEGLGIGLRHSADASRLLSSLNDLGAEMEVFYVAGGGQGGR